MDQGTRNKLRNVVTQCRKLLEDAVSGQLEGRFGIYANPKKDEVVILEEVQMTNLSDEEQSYRKDLLAHYDHIRAFGSKSKDALGQLVREIAFTHLNRLCAYKMMEAREVYIGGQKFRESVSRGVNSNGVKFYLANHPDDERLFNTGHQEIAYRNFLDWLGSQLSEEIGVLFNPNDPANRLYPPQRVLDDVLALMNDQELAGIWSQDETIGWVYQYFTPKELRDQARKESQAPRNSYELAFRNQFFTPRYVVEFLTDNTLGRIWYEMRKGDTSLKEQCRYMVRRPTEIFLAEGEPAPKEAGEPREDLSQEELLKMPVYIPHRPKKDPRELKILDPACGSGHFLLYSFDLLLPIYEEAYNDPNLGSAFRADYPTLEEFKKAIPALVLKHNLHGIDIDLRCTQIAALALWLRCQRECQKMGLKKDRPPITKSNIVCAEPMPGEQTMLKEFVAQLEPKLLGQLVEVVFDKMKLAGEVGSLLKIEEEIRGAVAEAKRQWISKPAEQLSLLGFGIPKQEQLRFDLSGLTDDQFFEKAEAKVIDALRLYAEQAHDSQRFQKRLFFEDAVRGFSFIEMCYKKFDVVLMNPPFGADCKKSSEYLKASYPDSHDDLAYVFVERALNVLPTNGSVGALTTRTGFFLPTFSEWRKQVLGGGNRLTVCADLGYGVLDALVETAAYTAFKNKATSVVTFIDLLQEVDKEKPLLDGISGNSQNTHIADTNFFNKLPGSPLAYWAPPQMLACYSHCELFEPAWGVVKRGVATGDNERFLRLWWEVAPDSIGPTQRWIWYAKGGEYSPYFISSHLLLDWNCDGRDLKNFTDEKGKLRSRPQNLEFFFRPGLAYASRTTSAFGPRVLQMEHGFDQTSNPIFLSGRVPPLTALTVLMSRPVQTFVELVVGSGDTSQSGTAARDYTNGLIGTIPVPFLSVEEIRELEKIGTEIVSLTKIDSIADETTVEFCGLSFAETCNDGILASCISNVIKRLGYKVRILCLSYESELICDKAFKVAFEAKAFMDRFIGRHPWSYRTSPETAEFLTKTPVRQETKKCFWADRDLEMMSHQLKNDPEKVSKNTELIERLAKQSVYSETAGIVSFSIGSAFGRWNVQKSTPMLIQEQKFDPLGPLSSFSPAMIRGTEQIPPYYPLSVNLDGILVDDPGHSDDIIRRVCDVLEVIWKDRAEAIEKEACGILSIKDLRDYFRKPSKGGFWDDHISRYSKSRRKAPIYWLLQSSKKNYALWIYYHRLDKDILFKALLNHVEPKIRLEENRLDSLRSQRSGSGDPGKTNKKLDKEIEKQEDFLSELRDFEDKLRRAANLQLDPDLNDGVVLNIAPLHELVPWKEAKDYWEELLKGKYEWSSIGKQLREKGLVK